MKKFIKWLADVSGVTTDIQRENAKYIGSSMKEYSYWFTGGLMHDRPLNSIANFLIEYPKRCLDHGSPHLYGSQFMDLRSDLYKLAEKDSSVFDKTKE